MPEADKKVTTPRVANTRKVEEKKDAPGNTKAEENKETSNTKETPPSRESKEKERGAKLFVKSVGEQFSELGTGSIVIGLVALFSLFMGIGNMGSVVTLSANDQVLKTDTIKVVAAIEETNKGLEVVSKSTEVLDTRTQAIDARLNELNKKVDQAMKSADTLRKIKDALLSE